MKLKNSAVVLPILTGLLFSAGSLAEAKDQNKQFSNHSGGQAATHKSGKASVTNHAQWYADPIRGWVRAPEQQELPKPRATANAAPDKGKQKTKGQRY